jgi:tape measure domain-containing protein
LAEKVLLARFRGDSSGLRKATNSAIRGLRDLQKAYDAADRKGTAFRKNTASTSFDQLTASAKDNATAIDRLSDRSERLIRKQGEMASSIKVLSANLRASRADIKRLEKEVRTLSSDLARVTTRLDKMGDEASQAGSKTRSAGRSVAGLKANIGKMLALAAGVAAFWKLWIDMPLRAAMAQQTFLRRMKAVTDSGAELAQSISFVDSTVDHLSLSLTNARQGFSKLAASAENTSLEGEGINKVFLDISTAMSNMGLSAASSESAMNALIQMLSKGKVSAEEFTQQLAEHLPGAAAAVSAKIGITTQELLGFISTGKLMSTDFLPVLAAAMKETFPDSLREGMDNTQQALNRIKNAGTRLAESVGAALAPAIEELADAIADVGNDAALRDALVATGRVIGDVIGAVSSLIRSYRMARATASLTGANILDAMATMAEGMVSVFDKVEESIFELMNRTVTMLRPFAALSANIAIAVVAIDKLSDASAAGRKTQNEYIKSVVGGTRELAKILRQQADEAIDAATATKFVSSANKNLGDDSDEASKKLFDMVRGIEQFKLQAIDASQTIKMLADDITSSASESSDSISQLSSIMDDVLAPAISEPEKQLRAWNDALVDGRASIDKNIAAIKKSIAATNTLAAAQSNMTDDTTKLSEIESKRSQSVEALTKKLRNAEAAQRKLAAAENASAEVQSRLIEMQRANIALLENDISINNQRADALSRSGAELDNLERSLWLAGERQKFFSAAVVATNGDIETATKMADEYADSLRKVLEEEEKLGKEIDLFTNIADSLKLVAKSAGEASEAMVALASGFDAYAEARSRGATRGQAARSGAAAAVPGIIGATGIGGGGLSQFGGREEGNFAKEGAQVGATFGLVWALVGAIIGFAIKKGADDMVVQVERDTEAGAARIHEAEGKLAELAPKITHAIGEFFKMVEMSTGAEINAALGNMQVRIRGDKVRVIVGQTNAIFDSLEDALNFGFSRVLSMQSTADGLGENLRALFEELAFGRINLGLEGLQDAILLAQTLDDATSGVFAPAALAYRELAEQMDRNILIAQGYNISLDETWELNNRLLLQKEGELRAQMASLAGVNDSTASYKQFVGSIRAHNNAVAEARKKYQDQLKELGLTADELEHTIALLERWRSGAELTTEEMGELMQMTSRFGSVASDAADRLAGLNDSIENIGAGRGIDDVTGRVGNLNRVLDDSSRRFDRITGFIAGMTNGLENLAEEFDAEEIARVWGLIFSETGDDLISTVRKILGEQALTEEARLFAEIKFKEELIAKIRIAEELLAATNEADKATQRMLRNVINAGKKLLEEIESGERDVPVGPTRPSGRRREERAEFMRHADEMAEIASGVASSVLDVRHDLLGIADAAEKAKKLRVAGQIINQFIEDSLAIVQDDFMAPFRETVLADSETDAETKRRHIEEERRNALAVAEEIARAKADAGMGAFDAIFNEMAGTINAAFDIQLFEVNREEAERLAAAEREQADAAAEATRAANEQAEAQQRVADSTNLLIQRYNDSSQGTGKFIIALRNVRQDFANARAELEDSTLPAWEKVNMSARLAAAEAAAVSKLSIDFVTDLGGWLKSVGSALPPELTERIARAQFEMARAQAIATLTTEAYRDALIGLNVDVAGLIKLITDLEFPGVEGRAPRAQRFPGGAIQSEDRSTKEDVDKLAGIRDRISALIDEWTRTPDPIRRALEDVTRQVDSLSQELLDAGGSIQELVKLEAAGAHKRRMILESHFQQLEDRIAQVEFEDPKLSKTQQFETMFAKFENLAESVRKGEFDKLGEALEAEASLRGLLPDLFETSFGAGSIWETRLDELLKSMRLQSIDPAGDAETAQEDAMMSIRDAIEQSASSQDLLIGELVSNSNAMLAHNRKIIEQMGVVVAAAGTTATNTRMLVTSSNLHLASASLSQAHLARISEKIAPISTEP